MLESLPIFPKQFAEDFFAKFKGFLYRYSSASHGFKIARLIALWQMIALHSCAACAPTLTCEEPETQPELNFAHAQSRMSAVWHGALDIGKLPADSPTARRLKAAEAAWTKGREALYDACEGDGCDSDDEIVPDIVAVAAAAADLAAAILIEPRAIPACHPGEIQDVILPVVERARDTLFQAQIQGSKPPNAGSSNGDELPVPNSERMRRTMCLSIVGSYCWSVMLQRGSTALPTPSIAAEACVGCAKSAQLHRNLLPDTSMDPRVSRWLGGCLLVTGDIPGAVAALERSLEEAARLPVGDERRDGAFAAHYTIATLLDNLPGPTGSPAGWSREERAAYCEMKRRQLHHLDRFLAAAPPCHWHVPSACFLRCSRWVPLVVPVTGVKPAEVFTAHPDKTLEAVELFKRGQTAQAHQRRYFPQASQKTAERIEATFFMEHAVEAGVIEAVPTTPDTCAHCGAPATRACAGCMTVHYCARKCQKAHWGQGHKRECATMKAQRDRVKQLDRQSLGTMHLTAKPQHTKVSSGKKKKTKTKKS